MKTILSTVIAAAVAIGFTTAAHAGTTYYPSCSKSPKPKNCGGVSTHQHFYPSCHKTPKPKGCGGR